MARKRAPKVTTTQQLKVERRVPIRMDLKESDHREMERQAAERDISIASLARMVLVEWLKDRKGGAN